jgi:oligopeptide transport system ATP-binding protein
VAVGKDVSVIVGVCDGVTLGVAVAVMDAVALGITVLVNAKVGVAAAGWLVLHPDKMDRQARKDFAKRVQIIFQDPYASLNPRMTVGDIISEGIDIHNLYTGKERMERINELMALLD